jgi:hypothetical protein
MGQRRQRVLFLPQTTILLLDTHHKARHCDLFSIAVPIFFFFLFSISISDSKQGALFDLVLEAQDPLWQFEHAFDFGETLNEILLVAKGAAGATADLIGTTPPYAWSIPECRCG